MIKDILFEYCKQKKGASIDFPFGEGTLCLVVAGHILASFFVLKGEQVMSLKCEAEVGQLLRQKYPTAIKRGYHCPPVQQPYNNTVNLQSNIPQDELLIMIDHSYDYIMKRLSRTRRKDFDVQTDGNGTMPTPAPTR